VRRLDVRPGVQSDAGGRRAVIPRDLEAVLARWMEFDGAAGLESSE
jgi:hypothetical protein